MSLDDTDTDTDVGELPTTKGRRSPSGLTASQIIEHAIAIQEEFAEQEIKVTLRQLYYQFVGRGITGNGDAIYKQIGAVLAEARFMGDFPIDGIVDSGREVVHDDITRYDLSVSRGIRESASYLRSMPDIAIDVDRWVGQPTLLSIMIEKAALASVFDPVCREFGVPMLACRGYPSVSALWEWLQTMGKAINGNPPHIDGRPPRKVWTDPWGRRHEARSEGVVLAYFGDHDPDGLEIPLSIDRNLRRLQDNLGDEHPEVVFPFQVVRMALTKAQIAKYQPPPFPAKPTSARYEKYVRTTGLHDAWELDALNPTVLRDLARLAVTKTFDEKVHGDNVAAVSEARRKLRSILEPARDMIAEAIANDDERDAEEDEDDAILDTDDDTDDGEE